MRASLFFAVLTTKLVVSNLVTRFDNLLIFKDIFTLFRDLIHIAKDMPISAAVNAGFQDYWLQFCRAWTKKKATEVAYRSPTSACDVRQ